MKRALAVIVALALLVAVRAPSVAAPPYTSNTSGTTIDGVLAALTDLNTGATPAKVISAANTNATSVKASAGTLYLIAALNTTATVYYLKFYDKATAPTCNSDAVKLTIPVPAAASGGAVVIPSLVGINFTAGIGLCLTGGAADNDNTNAATGLVINVAYK